MKKIIFLFCLICSSTFSFAQKVDVTAPVPFHADVVKGSLPNGLRYFILKNGKPEKRAELRLVVNVGSNMEDDDQQGLAHFLEHMAFNGTKNFKKNELVDYLESVGTKFGPHLNAYTSFDETVYMLQIPTDKPEIMEKGMQILEDWAHNLSFDSLEVEKERGVVIEEWRLRKGAGDRMQARYFPVLFKDSRYADRLPIGKKEILENFRHNVLKRFYKDWYRPELMSVIVIGDVDVKSIEGMIREKFSRIPKSVKPKQRVDWPVPDHKETLVAIASDKEATNTVLQIVFKHPLPVNPVKISDLAISLRAEIYGQLLSARLQELAKDPNSPLVYSYAYFGNMVRTKANYALWAVVKEGKLQDAMTVLVTENRRIQAHGFTQTELNRIIKQYNTSLESNLKDLDKTESSSLTYGLVDHVLTGSPYMGIKNEKMIYEQLLKGIQLKEINDLGTRWIHDEKNTVIVIQSPIKDGLTIPTDGEVRKWWNGLKKMETTAWVDDFIEGPLVKDKPAAGKILSETKNEKLGITTWTLSNGAIVRWKKTDFKNDEILFSSRSLGGSSKISDEDYVSSLFVASILNESGLGNFSSIQLEKYLSDKIAYVSPYISTLSEGFSGSCSPKDLEVMMQLLYLHFTDPKFDPKAAEGVLAKQKNVLQNRNLNPQTPYNDTVMCVMNNYHRRALPFTLDRLAEVDFEKMYSVYKQRFMKSAGDFNYYFVGNIDENALRGFVETYIGGLPGTTEREKFEDLNMRTAKGKIERVVKKGVEPKSNVLMRFTGDQAFSYQEQFALGALMKLVNIKLREALREDKSGVYGVSASGSLTHYPVETFSIGISFGCSPENAEMLIKTALSEIELIKSNGCDDKDLTKIKETLKRERETDEKTNRFWLSMMSNYDYDGEDLNNSTTYLERVESLNSDLLKQLAKKYFSMQNYARFVLHPEK